MKRSFSVLSGIFLSILVGVAAISAQDSARVIKGGVLNGKAVSLPKPEYPEDAKKAGAEGSIAVTVTIDEEGNVTSAAASLTYQQFIALDDKATSRGTFGVIAGGAGAGLILLGVIRYATRSTGDEATNVKTWLGGAGGGLAVAGQF